MASTGIPTPNIGLNQWLSTDKPERLDFISDNLKIDEAFNGLETQYTNAAMKDPAAAGQILTVDATGQPTGSGIAAEDVVTRNPDGKIPIEQLPQMSYDPEGSAAVVQANLTGHINTASGAHSAAAVGAIPVNNIAAATGGTLPVGRGGTNAADAVGARAQLGITPANIGAATSAQGATADNAMPKAGGTFTGAAIAQTNADYTTRQIRNVIASTADPSGGANGDIWLKYS